MQKKEVLLMMGAVFAGAVWALWSKGSSQEKETDLQSLTQKQETQSESGAMNEAQAERKRLMQELARKGGKKSAEKRRQKAEAVAAAAA